MTPLLPKHVSPQLYFLYYMHITLSMIYNVRLGVGDIGLGGGGGGGGGDARVSTPGGENQ